MTTPPPQIFAADTRRAKRRRGRAMGHEADFIHIAAAEDTVDRLETVLKDFPKALFWGPGAHLTAERLTPACGVKDVVLADEMEGDGLDIVAPATALPFDDGQFNLMVCSMGLHAINDLPGALREARRVLAPDGLLIATFPGERTLHELRWALQTAEAEVKGAVAPRLFPMVAVKDAGALLQHAGLAMPVADIQRLPVSYGDLMGLFRDLRATGETCALRQSPRGALRRDVMARMVELYRDKHSDEEGRFLVTVDLITATGWAPHPAQPQPLKPGSATVSLTEALKTSDE